MDIDFQEMRESGFFNRIYRDRKIDVERVEKSGGWKDVTSCPICKNPTSEKTKIIYNDFGINTYHCSVCNCLYDDKIPLSSNTGEYNIPSEDIIEELPDEKKKDYRKQRFGMERINIIKKYLNPEINIKDARILDVGCNTGFFLDVAKDHSDNVEGIETAKLLGEYAEKTLGVKVHIVDIFDFNPKEKYDVITLFDVIEHVSSPVDFLKKCKSLLNKDGIILIFTPNYESVAFNVLGIKSSLYIPADHLLFFSKETVEYVAKELDMKLEMYETRGMDMFDILAFERDVNKMDISKSVLLKNINKIQNDIDESNRANHMRFILRRK